MPANLAAYTPAELALIAAGIAAGENWIFLGYDADEMARYYVVNADW